MEVNGLRIPEALCRLVDAGVWPKSEGHQELNPILGPDAAHVLSPIDDRIILMSPPFHTIADDIVGGNSWWLDGVSNPNEIDYEAAVIVADFGLGSDSPIILYYGDDDSPVVMYLRWMGDLGDKRQRWVKTHESFAEFARAVGLTEMAADDAER
jgi:hypothetical protein